MKEIEYRGWVIAAMPVRRGTTWDANSMISKRASDGVGLESLVQFEDRGEYPTEQAAIDEALTSAKQRIDARS